MEEGAKGSASELTVDNVGGVFVVLIGGVVAGFFVAMCEFLWKARKNARRDQVGRCVRFAITEIAVLAPARRDSPSLVWPNLV